MTKAVAYFRVSTLSQGRSGLGLDAQKAAVAEIASQRGLVVLAEYIEVESGKRDDRPQLTSALHYARVTGSLLVIAKLDRLSRNAAFLLALRDSGVRFLAADIPDASDITIGVLAVLAQAERMAISRRTKEAMQAIKRRIAADGTHTSRRSGRQITRLGNPNGSKALRASGTGNQRAVQGAIDAANRRAADLTGIIASIQSEGTATAGRGVWLSICHYISRFGLTASRWSL